MIDARRVTASQDEPEKPGEEAWTIGRLLSWTTDYLKRRGSESPRLDAEVMLSHVLKRQRVELYTHFNEEVGRACAQGLPRAGGLAGGRVTGGLPRGPQGVFLAHFRRVTGRADPAPGVGVRRHRVPRQ